MDLKEASFLGRAITTHWYYRSKAKAVWKLLANRDVKRILDVGAGSGYFSKYLLSISNAEEAWCVDIGYESDSDTTEHAKPVHFRRSIESVDADLVLFMDVLEHVDDDVGLLKTYASKVPRRTTFLISVPAFQFLWSAHDVFLEHKRRYTLRQIEAVVQRAGLTVRHGAYYFGAVLPFAATARIIGKLLYDDRRPAQSQLRQYHPVINETLAVLSLAELKLMSHNRLAGLTAFCLAEST